MEIKYVVIDLSKIDGDKLSEMLEKAYKDGYQKAANVSAALMLLLFLMLVIIIPLLHLFLEWQFVEIVLARVRLL